MKRRRTGKESLIMLIVFVSIILGIMNPLLLSIPIIGGIVYAIYRYRISQQRKKREHEIRESLLWAGNLDNMNGTQFEKMLCFVFEKLGYDVKHMGRTGDFGTDILLKDGAGKKIAIQSKRSDKNVGNKAVQEAISGKIYHKADEGWVITNSYFTIPAKKQAESSGVKLVDRDELFDLIAQARELSKVHTH